MSLPTRWRLQKDICRSLRTTIRRGSECQTPGRRASTNVHGARLTLSAVEGPKDPPLVHKSLPAYFNEDILARHADRPALICRREPPRHHGGPRSHNLGVDTHLAWSFGELDEHTRALARGLIGLGVRKGDRVGVIMGNNRCVCRWGSHGHGPSES